MLVTEVVVGTQQARLGPRAREDGRHAPSSDQESDPFVVSMISRGRYG